MQQFSVEVPGGLVDPGEDHRTAAARELEEETGYRAGKLERLGEVFPNPALFNNSMSFWLATELELAWVPFLLEGVGGDPTLNLPDGIHPNAEGQELVAETVAPVLEETLRAIGVQ